jgi:hypothetical protein
MAEIRRKFDRDFQQGAVRLVLETGKPIAQVARDLGVNAGTLEKSRENFCRPCQHGGVPRVRSVWTRTSDRPLRRSWTWPAAGQCRCGVPGATVIHR